MKKYIQSLPLTAFAAASMLAGSLNANEMAPGGTRTRDQQTRNQRSAHADDHSAARQTHSQAMKGSDLLGMNINTVADDNVGDINEIFIDFQSGEVLAVVVSTGGFLGMGQRQSVISPKDLRFNNDRTEMRTDLSKEQIKTAPRYASGESEGIDRARPLGQTALMDHDRSGRMDRNQNSQERSTRASMDQDRSGRMDRHENVRAQSRRLGLSDLIGMNVENREGESVGSVDEVLIDHENSEGIGVVVSTGGFLGIGGRNTLFGLQEMTLNTEEEKVVLDYNKDQISRFPEYKADDQSVFDDLSDRMGRLNTP